MVNFPYPQMREDNLGRQQKKLGLFRDLLAAVAITAVKSLAAMATTGRLLVANYLNSRLV